MAKVTVGTTPVKLGAAGRQRLTVQNLGPGIVYLDEVSNVTAATGLQIPVGAAYETAGAVAEDGAFWAISDTVGTDVRFLALGG